MKVNGTEINLAHPQSLLAFLQGKNYQLNRVAVELNGEIVPKLAYADSMLSQDDVLEVVSFVGGG